MIVVRNVFRVKFGQSKEAVALWKESFTLAKKIGFPAKSSRVLTDLVGQFYTVVFENTFESLSDFENAAKTVMANPDGWNWAPNAAATSGRDIFGVPAPMNTAGPLAGLAHTCTASMPLPAVAI